MFFCPAGARTHISKMSAIAPNYVSYVEERNHIVPLTNRVEQSARKCEEAGGRDHDPLATGDKVSLAQVREGTRAKRLGTRAVSLG